MVISAKKAEKKEEKKKNYYRCERYQGGIYRSVDLPSSIKIDKVKAKFKNGVLKVTLPKEKEAKEKETRIKVE